LPFAQHRDIFYLSGQIKGKHFIAISDAPYEHQREMIFLKETNEHIAIWEGEN
jgi:Xaa-Pro aminopeptidase